MASSDKSELVLELQGKVSDASAAVLDLHNKWDQYLDYYQGNQDEGLGLDEIDVIDWTPVNMVFSHAETCVPIILDAAPLWYVKALKEQHEGNAGALTDALQGLWYMRRVARQYKMCARDQILLGTGFLKPWWNPEIGDVVQEFDEHDRLVQRRLGDVDVSWVDPYSVYPDPTARSLDECEFLALASDVPADRAKRLWSKFEEQGAQAATDDPDRKSNFLSRALGWVLGRLATRVETARPLYRVWEVYHEGGRRLTIYTGSNVLWDGANPTPGEAIPLAVFPAHERGYSFFGMPVTSQIYDLQTGYNKLNLRLAQYTRLCANPKYVTNTNNTATSFTDQNRPGGVVNVQGPDAYFKPLEVAPLPPWVFNVSQRMKEDIDLVTGVHDVTRGIKPGAVQSGIGIQQLQEAAQTRLRSMIQENTLQLERLGQITLEFMQQYYKEDRQFAYQSGSKLVRGNVETGMLRESIANPAGDMGMPGMEGMEGMEALPEFEEPIKYRVVVESGATLPLNAMAQAELAFKSAQTMAEDGVPMIDREAFLAAVKYPGRKDILDRLQARQQAMMQGQMAAQAQQQGPPGAEQGAAGPQGGGGLDQVLQAIMQSLGPEDQQILMEILQQAATGEPLTSEQQSWILALPAEVQQVLAQVLGAMGPQVGGQQPGMMGVPQMGLV